MKPLATDAAAVRPAEISAAAWAVLVRHLESQLDAERARTARILHDELGGLLVAVKMDLADLQRSLPGAAGDPGGPAQRAQRGIELAIATERRLVEALQPGLLVHVGLIAALRGHLEYFRGPQGRRVRATLPVEEADLLLPRRTALYQAVKDALDFACEQAAESVSLIIGVASNEITVRITPFAVPEQAADADARLLAIRHRLQSLSGTVEMTHDAEGQQELVLRAPCAASQE